MTHVARVDVAASAPGLRTAVASATHGSGQRRDIQALRAIAVSSVVLYHLWPARLPGGYVGVDVFFVISGFLITLQLLRRPPSGARDLFTFWARRVRRLVPAATVALVATVVVGFVWLPETVHARLAQEVAASSLYVENWVLAGQSTNYLDQGQLHSATQHFWSLSVEEQFYVLWPVVIGLLVAARRLGRRRVLIGLGALMLVSFAWSAYETTAHAAAAYFVSTTRVWELALGGVAAVAMQAGLVPCGPRLRATLAWLGLLGIAVAVLSFDAATPFPGAAALLPTVAAVLVLVADGDGLAAAPSGVLGRRSVQWVGDVSYSLYLWHWPVIVVAPFVVGSVLRWYDKLVVLLVALALAAASKRFVEDKVRFHSLVARSTPRTFALLAVCLAASLGASGALAWSAHSREVAARSVDTSAPCFGAAAFRTDRCADQRTSPVVTSPVVAKDDKPDVYADKCWSNRPFTGRTVCHYGDQTSDLRIAVIGNSHAGQWQPPLAEAASRRGWALDTYLVSECYTVDVPVSFSSSALTANCAAYNAWALQAIARGHYDVVVMADRTTTAPLVGVPAEAKSAVARASYARVLDRVLAGGAQVLVIRDTPSQTEVVPDCVAQHEQDPQTCSTPRSTALEDDPLATAAKRVHDPRVGVLDVSDLMCDDDRCYGVVGGAIAYFDYGHMTKTFSLTLEPEVENALERRFASRS